MAASDVPLLALKQDEKHTFPGYYDRLRETFGNKGLKPFLQTLKMDPSKIRCSSSVKSTTTQASPAATFPSLEFGNAVKSALGATDLL